MAAFESTIAALESLRFAERCGCGHAEREVLVSRVGGWDRGWTVERKWRCGRCKAPWPLDSIDAARREGRCAARLAELTSLESLLAGLDFRRRGCLEAYIATGSFPAVEKTMGKQYREEPWSLDRVSGLVHEAASKLEPLLVRVGLL